MATGTRRPIGPTRQGGTWAPWVPRGSYGKSALEKMSGAYHSGGLHGAPMGSLGPLNTYWVLWVVEGALQCRNQRRVAVTQWMVRCDDAAQSEQM